VLTQSYQVTPDRAWHTLGYGDLTARERHRLTLATTELGSLSAAYDDVKRADQHHTPAIESTLACSEAERLHDEMMLPDWMAHDALLAERFPELYGPGATPPVDVADDGLAGLPDGGE